MSESLDTDVLIVGAGPTGMVAALALAQRGVRSTIVDRRTTITTHPKAHEISSRSLEILLDLGIPFEALDAEASPYEDSTAVVFAMTLGDEIGRIDLREDGDDRKYFAATRTPKPFLNVSQTALERVLEAEVGRNALVALRLGTRWVSSAEDDDAVTSVVTSPDDGELEIRARYVLAADGASSAVRRSLGIRMVGPDALEEFVNAYVEEDISGEVASRAKLYFTIDPRCPGSFVAHHLERRWVYHAPVYRPEDRAADFDAAEMKRRIEHALGRSTSSLQIRSIEFWKMTAQVAERFRLGRIFLLGDAAHRFPPTGGLGMNSGIADAQNLAWKIAFVLDGHATGTLLDTYERERRPVIERNCTESTRNYERMFEVTEAIGFPRATIERSMRILARLRRVLPRVAMAGVLTLLAWFARMRVELALATPRGRRALAHAVRRQRGHFDRIGLDLGAAYDRGALHSDDGAQPRREDEPGVYVPSTRAGSRFPHFWLDGEHSVSSHSLVDPASFTLLVGPMGARWVDAMRSRGDTDDVIRVVRIEPAEHPEFDIRPSGALLVRPDGYVAFRAAELTTDYVTRIQAALDAASLTVRSAPRLRRVWPENEELRA